MLTKKQKANRAYYAKNVERIKAQKRQSYDSSKKPPKPESITIKRHWQKKRIKKTKSFEVSAEDKKKLEVRRRIEDHLLAKELEIEGF